MPPRFANPHLLPASSIPVSRQELHDEEDGFQADNADLRLLQQLNQSLGLQWESNRQPQCRKRPKIQTEPLQNLANETTPILFRLFSGPSRLVVLNPKPQPILKPRQPEAEDNDKQAALRKQQAEAAAINASQILKESKKRPFSRDRSKLKQITATLSPVPPTIMIIEHNKLPQSTGTPAKSSYLLRHPFDRDPLPPLSPSPTRRIYQQSQSSLENANTSSKRRRQRKKARSKERPPPTYWRPNTAAGGKGLGYAMGFPCSLQALQGGNATGYRRDRMRKATMV